MENKPEEEIIADLYRIEKEVNPPHETPGNNLAVNGTLQVVNGTVAFGDDIIDTTLPEPIVNKDRSVITQSIDDVTLRKIPTQDIEMDILRGGKSSEYIVMEKVDDIRLLKIKSQSSECVITQSE